MLNMGIKQACLGQGIRFIQYGSLFSLHWQSACFDLDRHLCPLFHRDSVSEEIISDNENGFHLLWQVFLACHIRDIK